MGDNLVNHFCFLIKSHFSDFPGILVAKTTLPLPGPWVQSLVGEIRFYKKIKKVKLYFVFFRN